MALVRLPPEAFLLHPPFDGTVLFPTWVVYEVGFAHVVKFPFLLFAARVKEPMLNWKTKLQAVVVAKNGEAQLLRAEPSFSRKDAE